MPGTNSSVCDKWRRNCKCLLPSVASRCLFPCRWHGGTARDNLTWGHSITLQYVTSHWITLHISWYGIVGWHYITLHYMLGGMMQEKLNILKLTSNQFWLNYAVLLALQNCSHVGDTAPDISQHCNKQTACTVCCSTRRRWHEEVMRLGGSNKLLCAALQKSSYAEQLLLSALYLIW